MTKKWNMKVDYGMELWKNRHCLAAVKELVPKASADDIRQLLWSRYWEADRTTIPFEVVHYLFENKVEGADINTRNSPQCDGFSFVHEAIERDWTEEEFRWLLNQEGLDVNAKDSYGQTPLDLLLDGVLCGRSDYRNYNLETTYVHHYLDSRHREKLLMLLRTGKVEKSQQLDPYRIVQEDDAELLELLVKEGLVDDNDRHLGETLLHLAIKELGTKLDYVEWLVDPEGGNADVNCTNEEGQAPLHLAVLWVDDFEKAAHEQDYILAREVIKRLLNQGAEPNVKDKDGNMPLHLLHTVMAPNRLDCLRALLEGGADVYALDNEGSTYAHKLARYRRLEALKVIYNHDQASMRKARDMKGRTVVQHAILSLTGEQPNSDDEATIMWLVGDAGIPLEHSRDADRFGGTVMHDLAEAGRLSILRWMTYQPDLEASVHYTELAVDNSGRTLLHVASQNGHMDVVKWLVGRRHAHPGALDNQGNTPHILASEAGHLSVAFFLLTNDIRGIARGTSQAG